MAWVYIIKAEDQAIKVGISKNVHHRLRELSTSSPVPLTIAGKWDVGEWARQLETRIHELLDEWRINGEWFEVHVDTAYQAFAIAVSQEMDLFWNLWLGDWEESKIPELLEIEAFNLNASRSYWPQLPGERVVWG